LNCAKWWNHEPPPVVENDQVKILWDFNIFCDHVISARRPDLTVVDKLEKLITLVDVSIPADKRVTEKEEKIIKNQTSVENEDKDNSCCYWCSRSCFWPL